MYQILKLLVLLTLSLPAETLISQAEIQQILSTNYSTSLSTNPIHKSIIIGDDTNLTFDFSITSKGNGGIKIPGIYLLQVYDDHDDLTYYKNGLLDNELIDINADGYKDILLWGTAIKSDDESKSLIEIPVLAVLVYFPKEKIYKIIRKSEEIHIYTNEE